MVVLKVVAAQPVPQRIDGDLVQVHAVNTTLCFDAYETARAPEPATYLEAVCQRKPRNDTPLSP